MTLACTIANPNPSRAALARPSYPKALFHPYPSPNPHQPFVGTAMIRATSADDPQVGQQASIQIEGSDRWLSALVPVHAPRGSRASTTRAVPVVGCLIHNSTHPYHDRFVLSWAGMRCRSVMAGTRFPAECDGASQRNVTINDTADAIAFVESLGPQSTETRVYGGTRRKLLDLGDPDNSFVTGKKSAIMVLISPSDAVTAAAPWNYGMIESFYGGSPAAWVDDVVRRYLRNSSQLHCRRPAYSYPSPPLPARHNAVLRAPSPRHKRGLACPHR